MNSKLTAMHLARRAVVYVRQSTTAQMIDHRESTARQYALVERAVALGWAREAIEVIDEDQGCSGAKADERKGFTRLVDRVAHALVGAILALEVSRLARASQDWQRLLGLCAVAQVLVIDEQSIYDPNAPDDKLLLDLKGTMSEAELQWLALRLTGARLAKARRGALHIPPPTGYVWAEQGLVPDPDEAVQRAVRLVFERYAIEPSAWAVVRWARQTGLSFPTRKYPAAGLGEVIWGPFSVHRIHEMLNNPVYAGAYVYGRRTVRTVLNNGHIRQIRSSGRDPAQWTVQIQGAHPGYISWETFMKNQEKLRQNSARHGLAVRGAPREGSALLSGLLVCGRCGHRMRVAYFRHNSIGWSYLCPGDRDRGQQVCWSVSGRSIDQAVERLFLQTVTPNEVDLSLAVQHEVEKQSSALAEQWRARLEQARYEARHAERRYKAVDPDNRVVARTLERQWEERLRALEEVERQYAEARRVRRVDLTEADRVRIRALAKDLHVVWKAPTTKVVDRKAMLRLAIEAISLAPIEVPRRSTKIRIQWCSGTVSEIVIERPDRRIVRATPPSVLTKIGTLAAAGLHDEQIAERLTAEGIQTVGGQPWTVWAVRWARRRGHIERTAPDRTRCPALPARGKDGYYSVKGVAQRLKTSTGVVHRWIEQGKIRGHRGPYGRYPSVWRLELDRETARRLRELAKQSRSR